MRKRPVLSAFASTLAVGLLLRRLRRLPADVVTPRYPDFAPADFPGELFEVKTGDGLTLRGKRYRNEGATPVMLIAGFLGNGFNFDIAFERSNFALYLARRGYDVWVCNFRGTGREPYKSDAGDFSHYIQDICIHDLGALVREVMKETGRRPVLMAHSLGGVVCYGYLQGVKYDEDDRAKRLVSDPDLARERNEGVAAVVSLAGPASFYWPKDSKYYWLAGSLPARLVLRASRALLARLSERKYQVPMETSIIELVSRAPRLAPAALTIGYHFFANLKNFNREMLLEAAISGLSDVSVRELYQLVNALLTRDLIASPVGRGDTPDARHNLSIHMHLVSAPILFVAAELDAVHPAVLYRDGFERVSSDTKEFKCFTGYGHMDLIHGLEAGSTVFPCVADWLEKVVRGKPEERKDDGFVKAFDERG